MRLILKYQTAGKTNKPLKRDKSQPWGTVLNPFPPEIAENDELSSYGDEIMNGQRVYQGKHLPYPTVNMSLGPHDWSGYNNVAGLSALSYYTKDRTKAAGVLVNPVTSDSTFYGFNYNPIGSPIRPTLSPAEARTQYYNLRNINRGQRLVR